MWRKQILIIITFLIICLCPVRSQYEPEPVPFPEPVPLPESVPLPEPVPVPQPPPPTNLTVNCSLCYPGTHSTNLCGIPQHQPNNSKPLCPAGQCIVSDEGLTNCTLCPLGSHQIMPGQTHCDECSPGSFSGILGAYRCEPCPKGCYCPELGGVKPKQCDIGKYCPNFGMYEGLPCPKGFFCQDPSKIEPDICTAGYYCRGGSLPPQECPENTYCEQGCTDCPKECRLLFYSEKKSSSCSPAPLFYIAICLVVLFAVFFSVFIWRTAKKRIREENEHKHSMEITSLIPKAEGPKYTGL